MSLFASFLRRTSRRSLQLAAGIVLAALATGCASGQRIAYSPHDLRAEVQVRLPADRAADVLVPFEPTSEMTARAKHYLDGVYTAHARADRLVRAITAADQFDIHWVPVATTVARDTARNGYGNCLSMTSLFVGLARAVGLKAYYVDASDRINSVTRADELIVDTGHIVATVYTERGWSLVDFTGEVSEYRTFRVMDDVEALAHFYNNRGYEILSEAAQSEDAPPWDQALADFQLATLVHGDFARAQNNLGVAWARLGNDTEAEAAYRAAAAADDRFAAPRHNLGNLHLRREEPHEAARWYSLAIKLQKNNPYAHYHLGLALMRAGDLDGSVKSFERAIALKHDYPEPRNMLAQVHRRRDREAERTTAAPQRQR